MRTKKTKKQRGRRPSVGEGQRFNFYLPDAEKKLMEDVIAESKAVANLPLSYSYLLRSGLRMSVEYHRRMIRSASKGKFNVIKKRQA